MSYCPLRDRVVCTSSCAWYSHGKCSFILSIESIVENLKDINSKIIKPDLEEIQKTKEINTTIALNNIETQKKATALLDTCQNYIQKEQVRAQLELEKLDT